MKMKTIPQTLCLIVVCLGCGKPGMSPAERLNLELEVDTLKSEISRLTLDNEANTRAVKSWQAAVDSGNSPGMDAGMAAFELQIEIGNIKRVIQQKEFRIEKIRAVLNSK
jgi:hypothetical protein